MVISIKYIWFISTFMLWHEVFHFCTSFYRIWTDRQQRQWMKNILKNEWKIHNDIIWWELLDCRAVQLLFSFCLENIFSSLLVFRSYDNQQLRRKILFFFSENIIFHLRYFNEKQFFSSDLWNKKTSNWDLQQEHFYFKSIVGYWKSRFVGSK